MNFSTKFVHSPYKLAETVLRSAAAYQERMFVRSILCPIFLAINLPYQLGPNSQSIGSLVSLESFLVDTGMSILVSQITYKSRFLSYYTKLLYIHVNFICI